MIISSGIHTCSRYIGCCIIILSVSKQNGFGYKTIIYYDKLDAEFVTYTDLPHRIARCTTVTKISVEEMITGA